MNISDYLRNQKIESNRKIKTVVKKCKEIDSKFENFDKIDKEDFECAICMAFIAEPIIKICKCCANIFLPIALAASSLSLMALNILPHGEFKAS